MCGLVSELNAQHEHEHDDEHAFPLIEQAFERGEISKEQALLYKFRTVFDPEKLDAAFIEQDGHVVKCLTPTIVEFYNSKSELSAPAISEIESFMIPASVSQAQMATYVSPSGKFVINYETTGSNAVPLLDANTNNIPDYVEEAAMAADSSYQKEIIELGYSDPIPEGLQYPITIRNIGPYGFTAREFNNPIATSITVENDFIGFPSNTDPDGDQLGALRVTMAHELKHAIQFIDNSWSGETDGWLEMDATLMEEVVYDETNDYYNYIVDTNFGSPIFQRASTSIIPGSYEDVTFAIYYTERFGDDFWVDVWTRIRNDNSITMLEAIEAEVDQRGEDYITTLVESYAYHYASGSERSTDEFGFEEREFYPAPLIQQTFNGIPQVPTEEITMAPVSARFFEFVPAVSIEGTASIVVTHNTSTAHIAAIAYFKDGTSEVRIQKGSAIEPTRLGTGWEFDDLDRMGIIVVSSQTSSAANDRTRFQLIIEPDIPQQTELLQNFPNPFNPTTNIQFRLAARENVRLSIYDVTGRLVQTIQNQTFDAGVHTVRFDGTGLSTGIYIYELRTPSTIQTEKMTLIK